MLLKRNHLLGGCSPRRYGICFLKRFFSFCEHTVYLLSRCHQMRLLGWTLLPNMKSPSKIGYDTSNCQPEKPFDLDIWPWVKVTVKYVKKCQSRCSPIIPSLKLIGQIVFRFCGIEIVQGKVWFTLGLKTLTGSEHCHKFFCDSKSKD